MAELKSLVREALHHITEQNWMAAVQHAERLQDEDARRDIAVDHFTDKFIIRLSDSSDEDSSE